MTQHAAQGPTPAQGAETLIWSRSAGVLVWRRRAEILAWPAVMAVQASLLAKYHWALELFSHFLPAYLPFLLLGILAARRHWRRLIFLAAALYIIVQIGAIYLPAHPAPATRPHSETTPASAENAQELQLTAFNIYLRNPAPGPLQQWLKEKAGDIVFLTELTPRLANELEDLRRSHPWNCAQPDDSPFGLGLYSRRPLQSCEVRSGTDSPYPWIQALTADGLQVFGLHPPPPLGEQLAHDRNVHLQQLAREVQPHASAVVLGDLNSSSWSPHFSRFLQQAGLKDARQGRGILPTWTPYASGPPLLALDHVLVKGVTVSALQRGPALGSDHRPLQVRLQLQPRLPDGGAATGGGIPRPDAQAARKPDK